MAYPGFSIRLTITSICHTDAGLQKRSKAFYWQSIMLRSPSTIQLSLGLAECQRRFEGTMPGLTCRVVGGTKMRPLSSRKPIKPRFILCGSGSISNADAT